MSLYDSYAYFRQRRYNPSNALRNAREDVANGTKRCPRQQFGMAAGKAFSAYGESSVVWMERPADYLRFVGASHEIWEREGKRRSRGHTGWLLDSEYQDETAHGVVYQLPARGGIPQYLYGYADPWNGNAACLSLDIVNDLNDAADRGDSMAEQMAEQERERQEVSRAKSRFDDLGGDVAAERRATLQLIKEAKATCASLTGFPAIKATIREAIESYRRETKKARKERAEIESNYGRAAAWQD